MPRTDSDSADLTADSDVLWKQYALHADLYKFYFDLVIKINVFYYAVTGGIASFYFGHPTLGLIKWSLGLPIVMSLVLAGVFFYGARLLGVTRRDVFAIRDQLRLDTAPDLGVLAVVLRAFACLFILVAAALGYFVVTR